MKSVVVVVLLCCASFAQIAPQNQFIGVKQFDQALRSFDATMLKSLYSTNPPAASIGKDKKPHDISDEINFWEELRSHGLKDLQLLQRESGDQQGM